MLVFMPYIHKICLSCNLQFISFDCGPVGYIHFNRLRSFGFSKLMKCLADRTETMNICKANYISSRFLKTPLSLP